MFDINGDEDDEKTRELDKKVEEMLREIAKASATIPEAFAKSLEQYTRDSKQPLDPQKVAELLRLIYKELPNISTIIGNWTTSLSAYATYRALKRQERISGQILRSNRLLARATVILALATFSLVLVSVLHL